MQSCSTQNHTRGSWHQTELVRADLGSLMRWVRAHPHTHRGLGGSLRGTGGSKQPPGSSKSMIVAQKQSKSKQASTSTYPTAHCTVIHGWCCSCRCCCYCCCCFPSFLPSFLPHHLHFFVRHCQKKTKKQHISSQHFQTGTPRASHVLITNKQLLPMPLANYCSISEICAVKSEAEAALGGANGVLF